MPMTKTQKRVVGWSVAAVTLTSPITHVLVMKFGFGWGMQEFSDNVFGVPFVLILTAVLTLHLVVLATVGVVCRDVFRGKTTV